MRSTFIILTIALWALLTACAGLQPGFRGYTVSPERLIELIPDAQQDGVWRGRKISTTYHYKISGSQMELEGEVNLSGKRLVDTFNLTVHFANADGKILGGKILTRSSYRKRVRSLAYREIIQLPEGTTTMAFSYSGVSRGIGQGSGSQNVFWYGP